MSYLVFDTETTGIVNFKLPNDDPSQPHLIQLGAILFDDNHQEQASINVMIQPNKSWVIPAEATNVHGITTERAQEYGITSALAMRMFSDLMDKAHTIVAHNLDFDFAIIDNAMSLLGFAFNPPKQFCTMKAATDICRLPNKPGYSGFKWPRLGEAYRIVCGKGMEEGKAHSALYDCKVCAAIYQELLAGRMIYPQ